MLKQLSVSATLHDILRDDVRIDATYYTSSSFLARKYVDGYRSKGTIEEFSSGTFNPPPIKRIYTDDASVGTKYMLPQEMFDFYWAAKKYVLADKMPNIGNWFLKSGWVVLTQSGSVGKPYFATKSDESVVLSQNAIRIPPKNKAVGGYIYAFLSTWIGQTLLKKDEFGITVKHIRPKHVDNIPIPKLPTKKQLDISSKVERAFQLRAEAIELLNQAKAIIYDELAAPHTPPQGEDDEAED